MCDCNNNEILQYLPDPAISMMLPITTSFNHEQCNCVEDLINQLPTEGAPPRVNILDTNTASDPIRNSSLVRPGTISKTIKVTDSNGAPLIGANIILGPGKGTITDFDGVAKLNNVPVSDQVTVSFMGFERATFVAGNMPTAIALKPAVNALPEVVVYGSKKQEAPEKPKPTSFGWGWLFGGIIIVAGASAIYNNNKTIKETI